MFTLLAALAIGYAVAGCGGQSGNAIDRTDPEREQLLAPGHAHYWSGDYDSAQIVWTRALEGSRAEGDSLGAAHLLTWLGLAAMHRGEYARAREHGEAALQLKTLMGADQELARSYNALGLLALSENRLLDALKLFELTRSAAESTGNHRALAATAGNLGLVHTSLGDLEHAAALFLQMQREARSLREDRLEANALTNLGMLAIWSGDPHGALEPLGRARMLYGEAESPTGEQQVLGQLATAFLSMGRYQEAFGALEGALALARRHELRSEEAATHRLLGEFYAHLGDPRRALRHFEEGAGIAEALGLESEFGSVRRGAAMAHLSLAAHEKALESARMALIAHRASGEVFEELADLLALAEIHHAAGDESAAAGALDAARDLVERLGAPIAVSEVALVEADLAMRSGEHRRALNAAERARRTSLEADFSTRARLHGVAARAHAALGGLDSAAVESLAAVNALERVRGGLTSREFRGTFVASSTQVYGDAVLILLQLGRVEEAFAVADAARSNRLLQRLSGIGDRSRGAAADPMLAEELRDSEVLLHRIDALLRQLRTLESAGSMERAPVVNSTSSDLRARIDRLRDEYEALRSRTAPGAAHSAAVPAARTFQASALRSALADDEGLIHYTITREHLVIFLARGEHVETLQIPLSADDLASRIRLLRELWGSRGGTTERGLPVAQALHRLLIEPIVRRDIFRGVTRLVIVPHGVLEQLPFAALYDRDTGRFLVEDYVLTYAPSAEALEALRSAPLPTVSSGGAIDAFAPFPGQLPGTRSEAATAARSRAGGRLHLSRRATEPTVRQALAGTSVVHIASHGVMNARNPLFSRIELARSRRGGRGSADDGRLETHEVLQMKVNSPLVMLSGCETAVAEDWAFDPLRPAGVTTLGQAFLHAGATNVVATLWRIDDVRSSELISRFYPNAEGGDVAYALAGAQRQMLAGSDSLPPYYWAGFVLIGRGRISPTARSTAALSAP